MPSPHTKEVLADSLLDCLLEWNIDRKLSTMIVDDCSTNDAMVKILSKRLQKKFTYVVRVLVAYAVCRAYS